MLPYIGYLLNESKSNVRYQRLVTCEIYLRSVESIPASVGYIELSRVVIVVSVGCSTTA